MDKHDVSFRVLKYKPEYFIILFQAELKTALKPLQDKLKFFRNVKSTFDLTAEHIKVLFYHLNLVG